MSGGALYYTLKRASDLLLIE